MMPPYAFRLARPTKSYSHTNMNAGEEESRNSQQKEHRMGKNAIDTMSEFNRTPHEQSLMKNTRDNILSDKLWDNEKQVLTQTTFFSTQEKQIRQVTKFFQQIGIHIDNRNCRQQNVIEVILNHVKPLMSVLLQKNKQLDMNIQQLLKSLNDQQDTIKYLSQSNKLFQSNESHFKLKLQHYLKQWQSKCRQTISLSEEIELKDQQLFKLKIKVDNMTKQMNQIIANEQVANRHILDQSKKRIEIEKELQKIKNERELQHQEKQILLNEKKSDLVENSVRMKLSDEKLKSIEKKYQKLKIAHNNLTKEAEQKQHYFHQRICQLQQQLYDQMNQRKQYHLTEKDLKERLYVLEKDNQDLKQELSEFTTRFLKLKQLEKIDKAQKLQRSYRKSISNINNQSETK